MILKRLFLFALILQVPGLSQSEAQTPSSSEDTIKLLYTLDLGSPPSGLNGSQVGSYISSLGDINGDNYDDWAVGLPASANYKSNEQYTGAIHIYFGGPDRLESETPADMVMYGSAGEQLGLNLTAAGDVNGDGFDDFLCYIYEKPEGGTPGAKWYLYFGGNPLDTIVDLKISKLDIHEGYDNFVSSAGDVNNDGYDDILLSVETRYWAPDTAHVYVYYGGAAMDNIPDVILTGRFDSPISSNDGAVYFGKARGAGDVNNDGYDDVIVKAYDGAELFFGGANMDAERDLFYNDWDGPSFGTRPDVKAAGDVNNDGYDDVLLTVPFGTKTAYIFYGLEFPDPFFDVKIPMWSEIEIPPEFSAAAAGDVNKDGYDDIVLGTGGLWSLYNTGEARVFLGGSNLDTTADFTIKGSLPYTNFGFSLDGGGDFDGDGYDDILVGDVGSPASLITSDDAGSVSVVYGGSTLNESPDAVFSGLGENYGFGSSVADAGDVNNDGFTDLLVGAPNYYDRYYAGRAFLYYGGETMDKDPDLIFDTPTTYNGERRFLGKKLGSAGDVNGDGYNDIYIMETFQVFIYLGGPEMDTQPDYGFTSNNSTARIDKYRFSALGDVNKDGFDDVLFSDISVGIGGTAWLLLGGENLMVGYDATFTGTNSDDNLGSKISAAGDLNGDAYMDFLIAIPGDDTNGPDAGSILVYFGGETINETPSLKILGESDTQHFGISEICGGGDINNDGYDDILYSDPSFSLTESSFEGRIYVFYGGAEMDNIMDANLIGDSANARLGSILKILPDIDKDGFDELLTNNLSENISILFGSEYIDPIVDLTITGEGEFSDFSYNEKDSSAVFLFGDTRNNAAGPQYGRVFAYSYTGQEITFPTSLIPKEDKLQRSYNYPNPFIQSTVISYYLPAEDFVEIKVYSLLGKFVRKIISERQLSGFHEVRFDARDLDGGVYFYRINAGGNVSTGKMVLLK